MFSKWNISLLSIGVLIDWFVPELTCILEFLLGSFFPPCICVNQGCVHVYLKLSICKWLIHQIWRDGRL